MSASSATATAQKKLKRPVQAMPMIFLNTRRVRLVGAEELFMFKDCQLSAMAFSKSDDAKAGNLRDSLWVQSTKKERPPMSKVSQLDKVLAQLEGERSILDLAIAKIKAQIATAQKRSEKPRALTKAEEAAYVRNDTKLTEKAS